MNNLQRRSCLLLLHLHPADFRQRFADEMFHDYEDLLASHGSFWLTMDLLMSLLRQWGAILYAGIWPKPAASPQTLLAGAYALRAAGMLPGATLIRTSLL